MHVKEKWEALRIPDDCIMASFDVKSLFTSIPVDLAIKSMTTAIQEDNAFQEQTSLRKEDVIELVNYV